MVDVQKTNYSVVHYSLITNILFLNEPEKTELDGSEKLIFSR
jgi:hypothetical protein